MEEIDFGRVNEGGDDKERLEKVIHQLEYLLDQIVSQQECNFLFYRELIDPMEQAWRRVSERFRELKGRVSDASVADLEEQGLTGVEFWYKLAVINHAAERFFLYLSERIVPLAGIWLKKLLEALDKLLTSILDAVGGSGAIGEFKSFMESSIKGDLFYAFDELT